MSKGRLLSERELRERVIQLVQRDRARILQFASNEEVADEFGLELLTGILPIGKDGVYIDRDAKIILNRSITSIERQRFTFFHELVHHMIRKDEDFYSDLHEIFVKDTDFDNTIEILCNIGAAELIIPRECVRSSIANIGFTVKLVPQLCSEHGVSGPAALIQLILCAPNHCFGVVCEYGISPIIKRQHQSAFLRKVQTCNLYILYAMVSPGQKYSLARWTLIPDDHLLVRAYETRSYTEGMDRIPFRSGTEWSVPCQALFFRGNVYGLFHITPTPSNQQLLLFSLS